MKTFNESEITYHDTSGIYICNAEMNKNCYLQLENLKFKTKWAGSVSTELWKAIYLGKHQ